MGAVIHFEIYAKNTKLLSKFYESVFGWKFEEVPGMQYWIIRDDKSPEGINGGMKKRKGVLPRKGSAVNAYECIIGVKSIESTIEKVKENGGMVATDTTVVTNIGKLAYALDPENNCFGVLEPKI